MQLIKPDHTLRLPSPNKTDRGSRRVATVYYQDNLGEKRGTTQLTFLLTHFLYEPKFSYAYSAYAFQLRLKEIQNDATKCFEIFHRQPTKRKYHSKKNYHHTSSHHKWKTLTTN